MKKSRPVLFAVLLLVLVFVAALCYRNIYLKSITEDNLGVLCGAVKNGKVRDYHGDIGVASIADVYYEYDDLLKVYKVYYGNYTVYLAEEETSTWSAQGLEQYLLSIGISFEEKNEGLRFYYYGQELSTVY